MKKFMFLYIAPMSALDRMANASPEEMQKGMEPWMAWQARYREAIVDMGMPLANPRRVTATGVTPSDFHIAGYGIVQADGMEQALEMAKNHPHLQWVEGSEITVLETFPLPGTEAR